MDRTARVGGPAVLLLLQLLLVHLRGRQVQLVLDPPLELLHLHRDPGLGLGLFLETILQAGFLMRELSRKRELRTQIKFINISIFVCTVYQLTSRWHFFALAELVDLPPWPASWPACSWSSPAPPAVANAGNAPREVGGSPEFASQPRAGKMKNIRTRISDPEVGRKVSDARQLTVI